MCGISGYLDLRKGVDKQILEEMTDIIAYRGPDDEGFALLTQNEVVFAKGKDSVETAAGNLLGDCPEQGYFMGLGHRRLSILDLSVLGHQPMEKHDKVMVYNGEIYNFIELREELKGKGYTFISNCDSEVILSAYDYWGEKCVEKFNGMWALAIYDLKRGTLFLSRDRFGVKPLYYYQKGEKLIFSSEIKQILCDSTVPKNINEEILAHYLKFGFREYSEETFFQEIFALRGGCNMTVKFDFENKKIQEIKRYRYYDLTQRVSVCAHEDNSKMVGDALRNAIKLRMRSDVKLGSCLSGGLDSSSIVGIVCDEFKRRSENTDKLTTVSIGFPDDAKINELDFCNQVAEFCECEAHTITPDIKAVLEHLEKIVWHQDEPLNNLGLEVSYAVFKGAADNKCSVFFDGQGGDEGLTGYYFYYANYLWHTLKKEKFSTFYKEFKKITASSGLTKKLALLYMLYFNLPMVRNFGVSIRRDKYLNKVVKKAVNKENLHMFFTPRDGLGRQLEDYLYGTLPYILHMEDRNSMASSVETRLPFLDYEYVEKVLSVDVREKLEDGFTKVPLRKYMKGLLPDKVIWRKNKLGFPAPTDRWFWEIPKEYVMDLLDKPRSEKYFNIQQIRKDYLSGRGNVDMMSKFILVEHWMRIFDLKSN
ncbi:MAG: asparagine synthase (glutamine-hydrolyzing) [Lachnoclostridium sp.]|nr:asparagine synthase (glutamine-hydrolyzing) [Lachnospira sp.]MCM1246987.1 asparagine synthase (glutamine-hydrolyzing) [Lachnoclostridium sp.]MCM1535040.1 asparagine synthase (glutamine-hydrolyzing) [Clostridium sp.]